MSAQADLPPAVELIDIDKRFGDVHANRNVSLSVAPATVHGIVGENGAGKSTLMSILFGFYQADRGDIKIHGNETRIRSTEDAIDAGIGMVHQHFMLVDTFSVLENVILGAESGPWLRNSLDLARSTLSGLEVEFGLRVDVDQTISELPVGLQQRVEILKALYRNARILILDEPTGVLTPQESEQLFDILRTLRKRGVTVILITHKLQEIMAVADAVTVMRAGSVVAGREVKATTRAELAELMVGRKVLLTVHKEQRTAGPEVLSVQSLSLVDRRGVKRLDDVGFSVRSGEIVGIAGVSGNGQTELLSILSGIQPVTGGRIELNGTLLNDSGHQNDAGRVRSRGVGHVPEDRLHMGLVSSFTAMESAILGRQADPRYNGRLLMLPERIMANCRRKMDAYDIRPLAPNLICANFSGGNQQKLVLAREMEDKPRLLMVGQPTRGVDIGAIEFIHREIVAMRDAGCAVLLVSVELDEIMSLADRILVMFEGRIAGEIAGGDADELQLGLLMTNSGNPTAPISST